MRLIKATIITLVFLFLFASCNKATEIVSSIGVSSSKSILQSHTENKQIITVTLNLMNQDGKQKSVEITDQKHINKIIEYTNSLKLVDHYGVPSSGGGIEVLITENGNTEIYYFKPNGDIKVLSNPDKKAWYRLPDDVYSYLNSFFNK